MLHCPTEESPGFEMESRQARGCLLRLEPFRGMIGEDVNGWLYAATYQMDAAMADDSVRPGLVLAALRDHALFWAQQREYTSLVPWHRLKEAMVEEFGHLYKDVAAINAIRDMQALKLERSGDPDVFVNRFRHLVSQIPNLSPEEAIHYFYLALPEDVRMWFPETLPSTFGEMIGLLYRAWTAVGTATVVSTAPARDPSAMDIGALRQAVEELKSIAAMGRVRDRQVRCLIAKDSDTSPSIARRFITIRGE